MDATGWTDGRLKALLVVDTEGSLFARIGSLKLGVATWRTVSDPLEQDLDGSTLILLDADQTPSWDRIYDWVRRAPTVIATRMPTIAQMLDAIRSGALGYLDTAMDDDALRRTLLGALRGEAAYARSVIGIWLEKQRSPQAPTITARLTERQRQIVHLIASGSTDRDIAARLGIRKATAQKHVANMLRRLRVKNRAGAVGMVLTDPSRSVPPARRDTPPR